MLQVGEARNVLTELKMSTDEYNWVQSIYFISYIVFEVPSNLLQKRLTPRLWQSRIMLTWGIVLACHAAVQNKQGLYALRFILGMCEAGMFPGIAAQLCGWYRSDEMGLPIMWMFGFQNTSGIVGSLITYGISYMNGLRGLSAWRWCVFALYSAKLLWWLELTEQGISPRRAVHGSLFRRRLLRSPRLAQVTAVKEMAVRARAGVPGGTTLGERA